MSTVKLLVENCATAMYNSECIITCLNTKQRAVSVYQQDSSTVLLAEFADSGFLLLAQKGSVKKAEMIILEVLTAFRMKIATVYSPTTTLVLVQSLTVRAMGDSEKLHHLMRWNLSVLCDAHIPAVNYY